MKPCIKCKQVKPIDQFYQHPAMKDGHLNKCIECCKNFAATRYELKIHDPHWLSKERERCRAKQEKYRMLGLAKPTTQEYRTKWGQRNKHKILAESEAQKAFKSGEIQKPTNCEKCSKETDDLEKHHPDYSQPLLIEWLCTKCHGETRRLPFGTPIKRAA